MAKFSKLDCLHDLQRRILSTDLEPGADLDEAGLAAQYGMSRTPMREVLQRLEGAGFAQISENRGAKVASMDIGVLRMFFQTAPMVYASIGRLAAENRSAAQLDRLKDAQHVFDRATRGGEAGEAALANHAFHEVIGEMSHNSYLLAALARLQIDHTRMSQTFYRPGDPAEAALVRSASEQHEDMIAAIEAREGARVVDLTMRHWDLSRDRMERFVRPDPLPLDIAAQGGARHAV